MLSVVVPVYNESPSLPVLHGELSDVVQQNGYDAEFVFVDDGSDDGSWDAIARLASTDARVRGIRFRRNFGKAAALAAGFRAARGSWIVTLDADLQDDPKEIPELLHGMHEGYDVLSGWKKVRHDPWPKVVSSRVFNWMVSRLTGVVLHDHNCGMKCYRQAVVREVELYGELHRFIPVLAAARGFRIGEKAVQHRPRRFGHSKYGSTRLVKGFLDLLTVKFLTGFGHRPLHMLGAFGLGSFLLGTAVLVYLAACWAISRVDPGMDIVQLHDRPALYYALGLLLMGGQLLSAGFLGELIIAYMGRNVAAYSVAETTFSEQPEDGELPPAAGNP